MRAHLFKFLYQGLCEHTDLRSELGNCKSGLEGMKAIAAELKKRREGQTPESKLGWYYRHWKGMNLSVEETPTFSHEKWDEQIARDPLLNKDLKRKKENTAEVKFINANEKGQMAESLDVMFEGTKPHTNNPPKADDEEVKEE